MQELYFPLLIKFRISTLANRFTVFDVKGRLLYYVSQKHYDLLSESTLLNIDPYLEEATVFKDASEAETLYSIKANKWPNSTAAFRFVNQHGHVLGHAARLGWDYTLRAHYQVFDQDLQKVLTIRENDLIVRLSDSLLGRIPFLRFFTGYFFNPSYQVTRPCGTHVATLKKDKSFLGHKFTLSKENTLNAREQESLLLSSMVMVLQERRRG